MLDLLARLVEKSLVTLDAAGERYRMLETVRQYALETARGIRRDADAHAIATSRSISRWPSGRGRT